MTSSIEEILAMNQEDANNELREMCYDLHGDSCSKCPVFAVNNEVPNQEGTRWGCDCFKDGQKMFNFIN